MKCRILATLLIAITVILIFSIDEQKLQAQSGAIKITDAIPATSQIGEIFRKTTTVNYTAGRIILAGNQEGTGRMAVDDNLYIDVTHPDGTTVSYQHFINRNFAPSDLTAYFQTGTNSVSIRIENVKDTGETSSFWLVSIPDEPITFPFEITNDIPTIPFPTAGAYFGRYFFVDYDGTGRLIVSSTSDGTGLMAANDTLYFQIIQPNGSDRVYTHFSGTFSPIDLTSYFSNGRNLVHFWLANGDTDGGSSSFWLTHLATTSILLPYEITPSIPAIPSTKGDFFGHYFYVSYDSNDSLWLSAQSEGGGNISLNGILYVQVTGADGIQRNYIQYASSFPSIDLSNYFTEGLNLVHIRLQQKTGTAESSSINLVKKSSQPPPLPTTSPGWQIKITDVIPSAPLGEFFNKTFDVDYDSGSVILSGLADGTGQMYVDDEFYITVTQPDGTQNTHKHVHGAQYGPIDLTGFFKRGTNSVQVRMVNVQSVGNASGYWLVNVPPSPSSFPIKISDAISSGGWEFLTKYFYVNYSDGGWILLSQFADGTGNMYIDDDIYINVTHPDGTVDTYQHGIGWFTPTDITSYFDVGLNKVKVSLVNRTGPGNSTAFWLSFKESHPESFPLKITDALTGGGEFFRGHYYINYSGNGDIILSQFSDGTGEMYVDDILYFDILHPDKSISTYSHGIGRFGPQNLTAFFHLGRNFVRARVVNNGGPGNISAMWLSKTGPAETPEPTSTSTNTPVHTPTSTSTLTPTNSPTPTHTPSPTNTPRATPAVTPTITQIRPNQGNTTAPNTINISGRNFQNGAVAQLGNNILTTTFVDATYLRADVPVGMAAGVYNLTVTNPDSGQATLVNSYTVFDAATNDDLFGYEYELVTDPLVPHANAPTLLRLKVHRQGGKQALPNVKVRFYLGPPQSGGTAIGDGTIAIFSPNSQENSSGVSWTPSAAGAAAIYAVIDPDNAVTETYEGNNVIQRTITVLSPAPDTVAPHVDSFTINDGAATTADRIVTLRTTATDEEPGTGVAKLLFVEFEYSQGTEDWVPVRASEWLDYATAQSGYSWPLVPASGMRYLQAWAADGAGNISAFPAKAFINFLPPLQSVAQNQRQSYRFPLAAGDRLSVRLEAVSGDPDLYVWAPEATSAPWISNLRDAVDDLLITAPTVGTYQVEVHGFTAAEYRLIVVLNPDQVNAAAVSGGVDPTKPAPSRPPLATTSEPSSQFAVNTPGVAERQIYLPVIQR